MSNLLSKHPRVHPLSLRKAFLLALLMSALIICGCSPLSLVESQPIDLEFTPVDPAGLSPELLNELDLLKQSTGYYLWQQKGDRPMLYVGMGLQPTGGYAISVDSLRLEGKTLKVSVSVLVPGPEDMVTQALTYPYVLVALGGAEATSLDIEAIEILTEGDYTYSALTLDTASYLTLDATYVGQIDGNSIEVTTKDGFMVFRNALMSELVEGFSEGDLVKITYLETEEGQWQLVKMEHGD